ncbi:uncharacterized [Tachysurus ichikawai]
MVPIDTMFYSLSDQRHEIHQPDFAGSGDHFMIDVQFGTLFFPQSPIFKRLCGSIGAVVEPSHWTLSYSHQWAAVVERKPLILRGETRDRNLQQEWEDMERK